MKAKPLSLIYSRAPKVFRQRTLCACDLLPNRFLALSDLERAFLCPQNPPANAVSLLYFDRNQIAVRNASRLVVHRHPPVLPIARQRTFADYEQRLVIRGAEP